MAVGGTAAIVAAALAFLDAAWSRAALAAELALLVAGAYLLLSRKIERVRASVSPLDARARQAADEIKRANQEIGKVHQSIAKLQDVQDKKIALAVQRIDEKVTARLGHEATRIISAIKDNEIESGLAALNRYTALAEGSNPESAGGT